MYVINAQNVNDAFRQGLRLVLVDGDRSESRNGPVLRMPLPVTTVYALPHERVLFDTTRHANPFFHLFEALWMLNGQNDVGTMIGFVKNFGQYSDDGVTLHGAYGHRWRHWPVCTPSYMQELDQIDTAIALLRKDPTSRRVMISMWDPVRDLGQNSKDIPCNDMIKLWIDSDRRLHMVVFNRSNDVVYGCYGANAVHMSVLHEYISAFTDTIQGTLTQISCDFHTYLKTPYDVQTFTPIDVMNDALWVNPYSTGFVAPYRLVTDVATFDHELKVFMDNVRIGTLRPIDTRTFTNTFFRDVAIPMHIAWEEVRQKEHLTAMSILRRQMEKFAPECRNDWLQAGAEWIAETLHRKVHPTGVVL